MGIFIALGSNLGERRGNLLAALDALEPVVHVLATSMLYESSPQPPAPPPAYYNAAVQVRTELEPDALLAYLKQIERDLGRTPSERWAPRIIDLDIALYDDRIVESATLQIPHQRLAERSFVLRPLLDLEPELVHPVTGERLDVLLAGLGRFELHELGPLVGEEGTLRSDS